MIMQFFHELSSQSTNTLPKSIVQDSNMLKVAEKVVSCNLKIDKDVSVTDG